MFQFFDETAFLQEWFKTGAISQLVGFQNNLKDGTGGYFNFILSNGTRSTQKDDGYTYYDHIIPADALNKIRSVTIYYYEYRNCIAGFSFFDKDGALLWEIGWTTHLELKKETVLLEENEVIVGVVAKLLPGWLSAYTDF